MQIVFPFVNYIQHAYVENGNSSFTDRLFGIALLKML